MGHPAGHNPSQCICKFSAKRAARRAEPQRLKPHPMRRFAARLKPSPFKAIHCEAFKAKLTVKPFKAN
jgi:hypothetical protein